MDAWVPYEHLRRFQNDDGNAWATRRFGIERFEVETFDREGPRHRLKDESTIGSRRSNQRTSHRRSDPSAVANWTGESTMDAETSKVSGGANRFVVGCVANNHMVLAGRLPNV
jgi:hypothetical protein